MNSPPGNRPPRFSIIIATYNVAGTLARTLASVVAQARDDTEIVVIDGGSADGTRAIIAEFAAHIAYSISEPDRGIYDAWNKGVRAARGDYIAFVGADDVLLPGALAAYAACIDAHPGAEYVSSRVRYGSGANARVIGRAWSWLAFRHWMIVAHVGSMHSRTLYERLGEYDASFAITGDYEFLLRAGPSLRTAFTPFVTVEMGTGGVSAGHDGKVFHETARAKALGSGLSPTRIAADTLVAKAKFRLRSALGMLH